jgi:hypothetical protein
MISNHYDATLFELTEKTNMKHAPYLENWFIMAQKNNKLIKDLYTEFIKSESIGFINYNTYLIQHAIINYLFHRNPSYYNINIKDSYDIMFKIHKECNWEHQQIINFIINNKNWSKYDAIKLTSSSRKFITNENINEYIQNIKEI